MYVSTGCRRVDHNAFRNPFFQADKQGSYLIDLNP